MSKQFKKILAVVFSVSCIVTGFDGSFYSMASDVSQSTVLPVASESAVNVVSGSVATVSGASVTSAGTVTSSGAVVSGGAVTSDSAIDGGNGNTEEDIESEEEFEGDFYVELEDNKAVIDFEPYPDVINYNIYRKIAGESEFDIIANPGPKKDSYTDKKLKEMTKYVYKVSAVYIDEDGEEAEYFYSYGEKKSVTTGLKAVKLKSVTAVKVSTKLKWKKSPKADGYFVMRRLSTAKNFKKIKKITGYQNHSYLDTDVKLNKKYVYKIVPFVKNKEKKVVKGAESNQIACAVKLSFSSKRITDKNSSVYGKKVGVYMYADGTPIENQSKYLSDEEKESYTIYVNKAKGQTLVYASRGSTLIPVQSFICSPGYATPVGTHRTLVKLRWHELMGPCWGQWCTKVVSNGIYFHSIFYNSYNDNKRLSVTAYNRLGQVCSHGCIRLQAYAAKWIYDNCKIGTTVVVCSKTGYEPLPRPSISALPAWHTWDPTDPGAVSYCKEHHCHGY
ncbi:MAG: L,D-transpeptidase family protein [Lachnospiraceae bacterium]|nr:L,D-transpeptidase family protein [Lachnospiraceae bacterium]